MHLLSYSSTVRHLTSAIRKLVRVNNESEFKPVYRTVRGELGGDFWLTDDFGAVAALDFAFMSASYVTKVCEKYMTASDTNVLWAIECRAEDEEGFHSGACVSVVSQFPVEREMLFPPLTMLTVHPPLKGWPNDGSAKERGEEKMTSAGENGGDPAKNYTQIQVTPTFI
jgi:hypothetical protein